VNPGQDKLRIDKWLWAVRLYKTRSIAAEACEKGRVSIQGQVVKASRTLKPGDLIRIHRGAWQQDVQVVQLSDKRMKAAMAAAYFTDITAEAELEKMRVHQKAVLALHKMGLRGRPTKKDRREMEEFLNPLDDW
jgi:ribosome-associated heat shock protein Hsp15